MQLGLDQALQMEPDHREALLHRAEALRKSSDHAAAITGACMGRCGAEIRAAIPARSQHNGFGVKHMNRAIIQFPAHNPTAGPIIRHQQINGKIFDIKFRIIAQ